MRDEIIVLEHKLTKTSHAFRCVPLKKEYRITLYMRDENFVRTIEAEGYRNLDDIYGKIYVYLPNFDAGQKPFCLLLRNGALHWFGVDDTQSLMRLLTNRQVVASMTNLRQVKAFLAL